MYGFKTVHFSLRMALTASPKFRYAILYMILILQKILKTALLPTGQFFQCSTCTGENIYSAVVVCNVSHI